MRPNAEEIVRSSNAANAMLKTAMLQKEEIEVKQRKSKGKGRVNVVRAQKVNNSTNLAKTENATMSVFYVAESGRRQAERSC